MQCNAAAAVVLQCLCILQILQGRVNVLCMTGDRHVSRAEGAAGTPTGAADITGSALSSLFVCLFCSSRQRQKNGRVLKNQ